MRARRRLVPRPAERRGASVVEMALVAPVFLLFVFGLVEFGRVTMVQQAITNSAREGCRIGILATTQNVSDIETAVRNHLLASVPGADKSSVCRVSIYPTSLGSIASGDEITTSVEVDFDDVAWYPTIYLGGSVLRSTATMKRE